MGKSVCSLQSAHPEYAQPPDKQSVYGDKDETTLWFLIVQVTSDSNLWGKAVTITQGLEPVECNRWLGSLRLYHRNKKYGKNWQLRQRYARCFALNCLFDVGAVASFCAVRF